MIVAVASLFLAVPVVSSGSTTQTTLDAAWSTATRLNHGSAVAARAHDRRPSSQDSVSPVPVPAPQNTDTAAGTSAAPGTSTPPAAATAPAASTGGVPSQYFGMHVLGPVETNISGTGRATLWPNSRPTTIRILNTWGYSPTQGKYSSLAWSGINTAPGVYDWSLFDRIWAKLRAEGVTDVVYSFQSVPAWACNCPDGDQPPTNFRYLADFATAVAGRARADGLPIKSWEAWNEPNSDKGYWLGTVPQMVAMAKTVYTAIKAVDPTYRVLTPAPQGDSARWMDGYLAAGGGAYADTIAFHGYTSSAPEAILPLIDQYKTVLSKQGQGNKPIWDTEAMALGTGGTPVISTLQHANLLAIYYLVHYSEGVERFYWYTWDGDHGRLWDPATGVNAAGTAYEQVHDWMLGATPGPVTVNGSVYSVPLTRNGKTSVAVWNSAGNSTFATSHTQVSDLQGSTKAVSGGSVTIGRAPVLLSTP